MHAADAQKLAALMVLGEVCYNGTKEHKILLSLALIRSALLILNKGASAYAPVILAQVSLVFSGIMHDYDLGGRIGLLALKFLEQKHYTGSACTTRYCVCIFLRCWLDPLSQLAPQYLKAYEEGMQTGDTDMAMWVSNLLTSDGSS